MATAPAGGCTARSGIINATESPTARAMRQAGSVMIIQTSTPTRAAAALPTTADRGCAKGLFGTANTRTEGRPEGRDQIKAQRLIGLWRQQEKPRHPQPDQRAKTRAQRLGRRACGNGRQRLKGSIKPCP